ncbi:DUF2325 domain-containing protein [Sedimenticola sp.]|uniref:DUF2325 domain-containing protein n=1 Tax=Sedimenticola sp. TaxID=1940285 RepID=UPI003D0C1A23
MCNLTKKRFEPPRSAPSRRLRIWEVERRFHCAILGTCLTLHELHKVIRQAGIILDPKHTDYDAHNALVASAGQEGRAARLLSRLLDRKYRTPISRLPKGDSQALSHYWHQALQSGDVAGPFWALVTHPNHPSTLMQQIYGDVHMLSHLTGAANRADLKRLTSLEANVAELREAAAHTTQQHHQQLAQKEQLIRELEAQLLRQLSRHRVATPSGDSELGAQLAATRRELTQSLRQLERSQRRVTSLKRRNEYLQQQLDSAQTARQAAEAEQQASELVLHQLLTADATPGQPATDLCGRQIVYVGGRTSLSPHFRALVERCRGRFEHHDGGMEESRANLHGLLSKADMVFCPIDCISHDACLKVKRFCKQHAKAFIPLRSSGLSAFAKELSQLNRTDT